MIADKFAGSTFVLASEIDESIYPTLPGYELRTAVGDERTSFEQVVEPFQDKTGKWRQWAPVVNLTITRELADGKEILLCVRRPDDEVHPDVVSTPTLRIPASYLAQLDLIPTAVEEPQFQQFFGRSFGDESFNHDRHFSRNINPFENLTQAVMSMKLGVADALERESIAFFAYPEALRLQVVRAGLAADGEDILETVAMFNVAVEIAKGSEHFPDRSAAHQKIFWANIEAFGRSWETKDLSYVLPVEDIDPFRMCIHGACIASSYQQLHGAEQ